MLSQLHQSKSLTSTRGTWRETIGIHHGTTGVGMHGPGKLSKRYGFPLDISAMAEQQRSVEVDGRVNFSREGIIGGDVTGDLHHKIIKVGFIGENDGVGVITCHRDEN